ncbi:unnamed protein product, partial [Meganyctiphanes norvegica]
MIRPTVLALICILIAAELYTIEAQHQQIYKKDKENKGKGKKKVCTYNKTTYKPDETILEDEGLCVALVCRKGGKKEKQRKKEGKGKKKVTIVPEAIPDCFPTTCMPMPCGNGRCILPPDEGPLQS